MAVAISASASSVCAVLVSGVTHANVVWGKSGGADRARVYSTQGTLRSSAADVGEMAEGGGAVLLGR